MIEAGVNAKAISTYMGHSSVATTFDKYGHLFDGNEAQAAELLDAHLVREAGAEAVSTGADDAPTGAHAGAHPEGSPC